jgi:hypothetical protein
MTEQEQRLLRIHNAYFTKPAVAAEIDLRGYWRVIYADGRCKWYYECGSSTESIEQSAGIRRGAP